MLKKLCSSQKQSPKGALLKRPEACNFIKKTLWHKVFLWILLKFLRAPFLENTSGRLLLDERNFFSNEDFAKSFAKFLRTPFVTKQLRWLLLFIRISACPFFLMLLNFYQISASCYLYKCFLYKKTCMSLKIYQDAVEIFFSECEKAKSLCSVTSVQKLWKPR